MTIKILDIARQELEESIWFYELEQSGLGQRFKTEVRQAIKRIQQYPYACPIERGSIRKCLVHRFPYTIFYSIEQEIIIVLAIAHQHRKPDYWIERYEE